MVRNTVSPCDRLASAEEKESGFCDCRRYRRDNFSASRSDVRRGVPASSSSTAAATASGIFFGCPTTMFSLRKLCRLMPNLDARSPLAALLVLLVAFAFLVNTVSANNNLALLSGTLKTFQAYACDDELLNIKCPHGTTISVQLAQYGRQSPGFHLCPPKTSTPEEQRQLHAATHAAGGDGDNTSCLVSSALQYRLLQVVIDYCQEKRQCKVPTSPKTFTQDPCPGIRKYVEVAYKCRPNEFITKVICEGEQLHLKCRKGSRIAIYSAGFGRSIHGSVECPQPDGVGEDECQASYSTEAVMRICHGKRKCTMMADIQTFGNPCEEKARRYLKVIFTCVPTRILISMYQSVGVGEDYEGEGESENEGDEELVEEPGYKPPPTVKEDGQETGGRLAIKPTKEPKKKSDLHNKPSGVDSSWPTVPPASTTKDVQGDDSEETDAESSAGAGGVGTGGVATGGTGDPLQVNCTVAGGEEQTVGVIKEWISAFNFLRGNKEKLILYLAVSVAVGLVLFMIVVIIRLIFQKRQERKRAKLNISEPLPNGFGGDDMSDIDQDVTDLSHSSPGPRPDPSVAVVRYTNRSTMRRQDSDTNPRAPINASARAGHNNFYYS